MSAGDRNRSAPAFGHHRAASRHRRSRRLRETVGSVRQFAQLRVFGFAAGLAFAFAFACAPVAQSQAPPVAPESSEPFPSQHEEVRVVAPTPVDGMPVDTMHFPGNIQHVSVSGTDPKGNAEVSDTLQDSLGSVHLASPQGGDFEPDVFFRGFESSPLLGTPQGISVYMDGVRLNETFGDSVHWSLIPPGAISNLDLLPGSDPLFGLNTIGGALSIHTKTGFSDPGTTFRILGGSFGSRSAAIETGGHQGQVGWFLAADGLEEDGWRSSSHSQLARLFGDGSWRKPGFSMDLSVGLGSSHAAGNGTAPESLLAIDRSAVFTSPDSSSTHDALVAWRARAALSTATALVMNLSGRWTRPETHNGDASPFFPCKAAVDSGLLCEDTPSGEQRVRDQSGQPVPADGLDGVENRATAKESDYAATVQLESNLRLFGLETRLVTGVAAEYGRTDFQSSVELASFNDSRAAVGSGLFAQDSAVSLRSSRRDLAGFFSDSLALAPAVALTVGGRFDDSRIVLEDELGTTLNGDHRASRFNPTAGVTWEAAKSHVFFANYSESFRTPTPVELTCADPAAPCRLPNAFVSDPPLQPVVARTFEAGLRGRDGSIEWSVAGFRTTTDNDIVFVSNGASRGEGHFENVGRTRRQGLELHASGAGPRWSWFVDYSYLDARFESAFVESSPDHPDAVDGSIAVLPGDRMPTAPAHNLKGGVRVLVASRWSAGIEALFLSGQYLRGDEANLLALLPSQLGVDVDVGYRLGPRCLFFVRVTNVLGRQDVNFGQVASAQPILPTDDFRFVSPSAPRMVRAGVQLHL